MGCEKCVFRNPPSFSRFCRHYDTIPLSCNRCEEPKKTKSILSKNNEPQATASILERLANNPDLLPVVEFCATQKGFVEQFDRLNGSNLSLKGSWLLLAIDEATGRQRQDIIDFIDFVDSYIFKSLDGDC